MYIDHAQTERINVALQVLGVRGVSVFGSSGDGESHWSLQPFDGTDPIGKVLNEVGCAYMLPVYPSPSPYMVSVGGTQWRRDDPTQPEMWEVQNSGSCGGFAWQFDAPAHQDKSVTAYLASVEAAGSAASLRPPTSYNRHGRTYPDISAVGVQGTSQSSPIVAGIFTMIADQRLNQGLAPLGFLKGTNGTHIWQTAEQHPGEAFESVNIGNSDTGGFCGDGCPAMPGWDPTTGWGRPLWPGMLTHFGSDTPPACLDLAQKLCGDSRRASVGNCLVCFQHHSSQLVPFCGSSGADTIILPRRELNANI
jgi:tripeptidyl-peptidase-1